jgi:hypothetical protein
MKSGYSAAAASLLLFGRKMKKNIAEEKKRISPSLLAYYNAMILLLQLSCCHNTPLPWKKTNCWRSARSRDGRRENAYSGTNFPFPLRFLNVFVVFFLDFLFSFETNIQPQRIL